MYLNMEFELALVAIQKCLVHDYLGPNTRKLWLHTKTHDGVFRPEREREN